MKKLLLFSIYHGITPGQADLSPKSNAWYARNYEYYFDEVYCISLVGKFKGEVKNGNTVYRSVGTGRNMLDILLSPIRFYKLVKKLKPDACITYEQVWLWWVSVIVRIFCKVKIYLIPITIPGVMYKVTGKSLSVILPKWLEKIFIRFSHRSVDYVVTTSSLGQYIEWLKAIHPGKKKLRIISAFPESTPPPSFFERVELLENMERHHKIERPLFFKLLYVGRLHKEKLVDHLIRMTAVLKEKGHTVKLILIGDGDEKERLKKLAHDLGVSSMVDFLGYKENASLPDFLFEADAFVSPLTGCSLREAAFCSLPIIAYNMDWVENVFTHEKNFLAAIPYDHISMANEVSKLINNDSLKEQLSVNVRSLAQKLWSAKALKTSLQELFTGD
jgi:glycosyltransferase involved in cell wall biosynthesis